MAQLKVDDYFYRLHLLEVLSVADFQYETAGRESIYHQRQVLSQAHGIYTLRLAQHIDGILVSSRHISIFVIDKLRTDSIHFN